MKILTIMFLLYYCYMLFNQQGFLGVSTNKLLNLIPENKDEELFDVVLTKSLKSFDTEISTQTILTMIATGITIFIGCVEFIYIVKATNVGGTFALMYLILWSIILIKPMIIKKKKDKTVGMIKDIINKFDIKIFIIHLIDISYFGYMFYIYFVK